MKKSFVLIVDNDRVFDLTLKERLENEDFWATIAQTGEMARKIIQEDTPDLAFVNVLLPDVSGIHILKEFKEIYKKMPVIMISGSTSVDKAVTAMKLGAHEYVSKPIDIDEIVKMAKNAVGQPKKNDNDEEQVSVEQEPFPVGIGNIVYKSKEMSQVMEMAQKISVSHTTTVLIEGESGTGKDLIARAIHYFKDGENKPYMDINCAAMPDTLVESELFGFEKGAFTDAKARKMGLFELAAGGSILLDEIGDIPLTTQAKLLKLIENKRFKRVGGTVDIHVNVRIIAATNKNIKEKVKKGEFREDLYYRLKVIPIYIPPLRDRNSDILPLAKYFISKFNNEFGKNIKGLSSEAEKIFMNYSWPGNVRELKNVIERAIILEGKDRVLAEHLPRDLLLKQGTLEKSDYFLQLPETGISLEKVERDFLTQALQVAKGNQTKAAKLLGLTRWALRYRMNKFGLADLSAKK